MTGKKRNSGSDWAKVDAPQIQPHEYGELPEWTAETFERADFYVAGKLVRKGKAGRPPKEKPKRQVTLRLDQDVIAGLRATGPGWQTRVNETLRQSLKRKRA
ncbi:MAG: hypothetical protein EXQ95_08735 [Alphaproteobacteria bacterium]|nr:hypothetical protein [Alphaproteobacteria bacterium]